MNKNVLVIGSGSIAKKHIINLKKLNYNIYISTTNSKFFKNRNNLINIKSSKNYPVLELLQLSQNLFSIIYKYYYKLIFKYFQI